MKKFNNSEWVHNGEFYRAVKAKSTNICDGCCFKSITGKCRIEFQNKCTYSIGVHNVFNKISESEVNMIMKNKLESSGKIKVMTMTEERSLYIFNLLKERGMDKGLDFSRKSFIHSPKRSRDICTILYIENGVIVGWDNAESALQNPHHLYWNRCGFKEYCFDDVVEMIKSIPIKKEDEVKLPFKPLDYVIAMDYFNNIAFVTQFIKEYKEESKFLCLHNIYTYQIAPFDPNRENVLEYDEYYTFENGNGKLKKVKK